MRKFFASWLTTFPPLSNPADFTFPLLYIFKNPHKIILLCSQKGLSPKEPLRWPIGTSLENTKQPGKTGLAEYGLKVRRKMSRI